MNGFTVYEVVFVKKSRLKNGAPSILYHPITVVAKNEVGASAAAMVKISGVTEITDASRAGVLEVLVRPF